VVGVIEGTVLLGEFLFVATTGGVLSSTILRSVEQLYVDPTASRQLHQLERCIFSLIIWFFSPFLVSVWLGVRYQELWKQPRTPVPRHFGLGRVFWWIRPSFSFLLLSFILVVEFWISVWWTFYSSTGEEGYRGMLDAVNLDLYLFNSTTPTISEIWGLDWSEFVVAVDWSSLFRLVVATPFLEELVFRGFLFSIIFKRTGFSMKGILLPNVLFGLFHLVNLASSRLSLIYILLQVRRSVVD